MTERGGLAGPAGKFARINPVEAGQGMFSGTFPVHFDADEPTGDAEFELTKPDNNYCCTHVSTGYIMGWDATKFAGDLTKQCYAIAPDKRGAYESPQEVHLPDGTRLMVIEYTDPRAYVAVPLAWHRSGSPIVTPIGPLDTNGRIFMANEQPWRYAGVTAFKLLNLHAAGIDISPFLVAYRGFNVLRVFCYTPVADWGTQAWDMPTAEQVYSFVQRVAQDGFRVELVLLTSDEPQRIDQAKSLIAQLRVTDLPSLIVEIGNEPLTHKNIRVQDLRNACEQSGFLYASGIYEDTTSWFGKYGTAHTGRDAEWPRRAHDLMEYFNGGGPNAPSEPACRVPWVADEPIRPDQASGNKVVDVLGYYGASALLGAGATVHTETGKFGQLPTPDEQEWAKNALSALNTFPADAPNGPYRRIDENSLRTYVVGNYMVRIRPTTLSAPEPGWKSLDSTGVLWSR